METPTGDVDLVLDLAASLRISIEGGIGVNGERVTLVIAGQELSVATLFFSQTQTAAGARIISVAVVDLRLVLRSGTPIDPNDENDPSVIAWIDGISGALMLTPQGIAAKLVVGPQTFSLGGGVSFSFSEASIAINTTPAAVNQTFGPTGASVTLNLPAGRFFRLEVLDATLDLGGAVLTGSFSFEQATRPCPPATPSCVPLSITKIGATGLSVGAGGFGGDDRGFLNVNGALVVLPDLDGPGIGTKGIAAVLEADLDVGGGGASVSGKLQLKINTTGIAVTQTVTVGTTQIKIEVGPERFAVAASDVRIVIGDFLTIEGSVSFSGDSTTGDGLLLFVGSGPLYLPDGSRNPDAVGLLVSNARISLTRRTQVGLPTTYALAAVGDLEILGIPGLDVSATGVFVRLNTTGRPQTLVIPGDEPLAQRTVTFATGDVVLDFGAQNITFGVGGLLEIGGGVRFSKRPNGTIDIALAGASVKIDIEGAGDFTNPEFFIQGSANFSIGGPEGFKLQSFRVNNFALFSQNGQVAAATPPKFLPTADLKTPFTGQVLARSIFNGQGFLDVQFNDLNNVGLDVASITDDAAEFELFVNGQPAASLGILVNGRATVVAGLKNVFRYTISGIIPDAGEILVRFIAGSFRDRSAVPAANAVESEYFTLVNPLPITGILPPAGPVGQLASPGSGASISLVQINGQRYIDVTFVSRSGADLNLDTINGDEFTLSGAITADLRMLPGTGGIPDIVGQPLKIGPTTFRYFFRTVPRPPMTTPPPPGTPVPTQPLFTTGLVTVTFRPGSFATVDGGLNVARTETFTIDPSAAGDVASGGPINLGPLTLQGPTVGIADFGFKDGLLVLTIAVGVDRASLAFQSTPPAPGTPPPPPGTPPPQQRSGVTVDLLGVLGTFDLGVDVFGLLSGNVRVELPGRWSFSVQSLEVVVPDVVTVTAEGITIRHDPAGPIDQEIVRIDEAVIQFQRFAVRGMIRTFDPTPGTLGTPGPVGDEIPGLVIRGNGFTLGVAELCFGCAVLPLVPGTSPTTGQPLPPTQPLTPNTNQAAIRLGPVEFDDIRFIVENFSFTVGTDVDFDGSIAIASGGARLFPGGAFTATITDRDAVDDRRDDGQPDTEALRLQLDFENGRVTGFVFEIDTLLLRVNTFIEVRAVGFRLDTGASGTQPLVEFLQVGAKVTIGSLEIGGEARNFAILGDGSFDARPGFGVFLAVGSATGDSFKWPSWLPIKINAIGIEWPDFDNDPANFLIAAVGVHRGDAVGRHARVHRRHRGLKISPRLLLEGKFPIVDIGAIAVGVKGKLFGGELTATLVGGLMRFDANGNVIGDFDRTTPVADRVFFFGIEGGFSLAGIGGLTIRLGLVELGPLGVRSRPVRRAASCSCRRSASSSTTSRRASSSSRRCRRSTTRSGCAGPSSTCRRRPSPATG